MTGSGEIRNENSGTGRDSYQFGTVHGDITFQQRTTEPAEGLAADVAGAVRELSRKEEEQWRIGDPAPLSVRWHSAEQDLFDHWENIRASSQHNEPVSLSAQFTAIRETFEATDSQRLLILGRAGAGKTAVAHRLILDLLLHRRQRGPVPVLFSLNDWNPATTGLRDWLADQLVRDHPFLAQHDASGKRSAELLVDRDWILPVLDGFDELPTQHHRAAISEMSRVRWPLVVTSRPAEYARAAHEVKVVGRAAAIELEDLALDEVERYLRRTTNPSRTVGWETVFERLRTAPGEAASRNLAPVLSTPLMVMLARTIYNDTNERCPSELLNNARFPTGGAVEQHLLGGYVGTVYEPRRKAPSGSALPAWDPERAHHWLGFLATGVRNRDTHDFTWWQLDTLLPTRTRLLTTIATYGLVAGLIYGLAFGFAGSDLESEPVSGILFGLVLGGALGLLNKAARARGRGEPERLRPYWRRRGGRRRHWKRALLTGAGPEFGFGLAFGLAGGTAVGLSNSLDSWLRSGPLDPIATAVLTVWLVAPVLGVTLGLVSCVISALGEAHDPLNNDPWQLLSTDRAVTLLRTVLVGLLIALIMFVGLGVPVDEPWLWVGSSAGLLRPALSAWGNWLLFARLWLPLTGRLPWRPKRFLEDAHARGMLRRAGAAYQFRHARLRDHLADQYRAPRRRPAGDHLDDGAGHRS